MREHIVLMTMKRKKKGGQEWKEDKSAWHLQGGVVHCFFDVLCRGEVVICIDVSREQALKKGGGR